VLQLCSSSNAGDGTEDRLRAFADFLRAAHAKAEEMHLERQVLRLNDAAEAAKRERQKLRRQAKTFEERKSARHALVLSTSARCASPIAGRWSGYTSCVRFAGVRPKPATIVIPAKAHRR
jgi:hypothetical protein